MSQNLVFALESILLKLINCNITKTMLNLGKKKKKKGKKAKAGKSNKGNKLLAKD